MYMYIYMSVHVCRYVYVCLFEYVETSSIKKKNITLDMKLVKTVPL